jgi:hypothetical protein
VDSEDDSVCWPESEAQGLEVQVYLCVPYLPVRVAKIRLQSAADLMNGVLFELQPIRLSFDNLFKRYRSIERRRS